MEEPVVHAFKAHMLALSCRVGVSAPNFALEPVPGAIEAWRFADPAVEEAFGIFKAGVAFESEVRVSMITDRIWKVHAEASKARDPFSFATWISRLLSLASIAIVGSAIAKFTWGVVSWVWSTPYSGWLS